MIDVCFSDIETRQAILDYQSKENKMIDIFVGDMDSLRTYLVGTKKVKEKYDTLIEGGLLPIKRWGRPEDVALAVYALCTGALPYVTGQSIDVDGGFHIRRL